MLSVIEYTLGQHRKVEVYVNKMLIYFLDPSEPHGMGDDFLRAFLEKLPGELGFDEDLYDLGDVVVADQVRVGSGYVDLVVEVPGEWFLMIELKFKAEDRATKGYYRADDVGGQQKSDYQSGHYYLYLHHRNQPVAREEAFVNWTWERFLADAVRDFCFRNGPRFPQRTANQLREFVDDIEEITGMTDQQSKKNEKAQLYVENFAAIQDVTKTFDKMWDRFKGNWATRLETALIDEGIDCDGWYFSGRKDWARFFKHGWHRHIESGEVLGKRAKDRNDARIIFYHRLKSNRSLAVGERKLRVAFRHCGSNDEAFRTALNRRFDSRVDEIRDALPPSARIVGNRRDKIEAVYEIQVGESRDFFEAYIDALKQAFVEIAAENTVLLGLIDEIYEESFTEVYGELATVDA